MALIAGCKQQGKKEISIVWSGRQAAGIIIPNHLLDNSDKENIKTYLETHLQNSNTPILGRFGFGDGAVVFSPFIPLTPGKQYEVYFKKKLIGQVIIPLPDASSGPTVTGIYPSADTLPENLLKVYLRFSSPMREGESLRHIRLLNEKADTIPDIFLDLQPELWNEERTTLTVWLDPGRIKRDLIPNQRFGKPLKKGSQHTLVIDDDWKSAQGLALKQSYTKKFIVGERDGISPQPELWTIDLPTATTTEPLQINFKESLDYFLVKETVTILNEKGTVVDGSIRLMNKENGLKFFSNTPWQPGRYRLRIASYLEDLAGNNLSRPFDRDVRLPQKKDEAFFERVFEIR